MDSGQQAQFFTDLAKEFNLFTASGYAQIQEMVRSEHFTFEAREFLSDVLYYAD